MTTNEVVELAHQVGLSFDAFMHRAEQRMHAQDPDDQFASGRHLNWSRMSRHVKTYAPSEVMRLAMSSLAKQTWVVITEDWCGDSAQSLPVIATIAALNPNVDLKILDRDTYPAVMDMYLTSGARAVPVVIAFDEGAQQLWKWGARPEAVKPLIEEWKAQFENKTDMYPLVHAWYAKHGHEEIERDIIHHLNSKG